MRMLVAVVIAVCVCISGVGFVATNTAVAQEQKAQIVDVGNAICPVTGDKVSGKDFYEYSGKRYGLCCPMCQGIFSNDPAKYAAIADKEVADKGTVSR